MTTMKTYPSATATGSQRFSDLLGRLRAVRQRDRTSVGMGVSSTVLGTAGAIDAVSTHAMRSAPHTLGLPAILT